MIRQAAMALALGVLASSQIALARIPDQTQTPGKTVRAESRQLLGHPVVLSDGFRIGRIAGSWNEGSRATVMQITLDAEARLGLGVLTLIFPGHVDPAQPIRLLLDHGALQSLIEPQSP